MSISLARSMSRISAVAIAVVLSTVFIREVEAKPGKWKHRHHRHDRGAAWWKNNKPHPKYYRGQEYRALPYGCRRVVIREKVYYTNNDVYFVYSPIRDVYIVVNPSFW
jgi:hypothetical protein